MKILSTAMKLISSDTQLSETSMAIVIDDIATCGTSGFKVEVEGIAINPGELLGMIGANGSGKTTLMESVLGFRKTKRRRMTIAGCDIRSFEKSLGNKRKIGVHLQSADFAHSMKVREAVNLHRNLYRVDPGTMFHQLGIEELENTVLKKLSRGQQQRVYLYLALAHKPKYLFLDEPFTALDAQYSSVAFDLLQEFKALGCCILMISHNATDLNLADRIAYLRQGALEYIGTQQELVSGVLGEYCSAFSVPRALSIDSLVAKVKRSLKPSFVATRQNQVTVFTPSEPDFTAITNDDLWSDLEITSWRSSIQDFLNVMCKEVTTC